MKTAKKNLLKAWIVSVDMGYGHQRAAYPLKDILFERILTANKDKMVSEKERRLWEQSRNFYEAISRMKEIPIFGALIFNIYDQLQKINPFFPFRDQSKSTFAVLRLKKMIRKGFGKSLVEYTAKERIPVITTHPIPAMMYNYNDREVYAVATDTDINRIWVPDRPVEGKITYFSPCKQVTLRLKQYGVQDGQIIETGFPLPKENIGDKDEIVKKDLLARLVNLDPSGVFFGKYRGLLVDKLGLGKKASASDFAKFRNHKLTLTYAIGGAGAQKEIALDIIHSLRARIESDEIIVNIVVGIKLDLKMFFENAIKDMGMKNYLDKNIRLIFAFDKKELFAQTNKILRTTDILWTKPSEMSFYTALGLPIIIAPPIGSHENYNKEWLEHIGSGFIQQDPKFAVDWIFYWLNDGQFADAALQGFIDAPRRGTYNIEQHLREKASATIFKNNQANHTS